MKVNGWSKTICEEDLLMQFTIYENAKNINHKYWHLDEHVPSQLSYSSCRCT